MKKRVVIVGGVAGGASAAARLRRVDEEAEIILIEKGEYISYANCGLPYYIGGVIADREKLFVQTPEGMHARYNIQVRTGQEVLKIDRQKKEVEIKEGEDGHIYRLAYDLLLLSPGAFPVRPRLAGMDAPNVFTLRNVSDTDRIKNYIREVKPSSVVVVGAGFIGLEMVENLHRAGLQVSLVEMAERVLPKNLDFEMAAPVHKHLREQDITLYLGNSLMSLEQSSGEIWTLLKNGEKLRAGMVIMAVGAAPDHRLAEAAGLAIGQTGGILVNERFQTSDPDIYAVGDAIEVKNGLNGQPSLIPLAGPANRQGRLVADALAGRVVDYEGAMGTAIAKVFDLTVASVGLTAESLCRDEVDFFSSLTHSASHANYYPGSFSLSMKLNVAPDGRILGAQVVGYNGVDKRLDVIATLIKLGGKVKDLTKLELAYAPPYSSAKDPVNIAGYVADNIISGDMEVIHWNELPQLDRSRSILLDVREEVENQAGCLEKSLNIPLPQLRKRAGELPKDKEIIIYCQVGLRGYVAYRILKQLGFKVKNLSGGYRTWKAVNDEEKALRNGEKPNQDRSNGLGDMAAAKMSSPANLVQRETAAACEEEVVTVDACGLHCPGPILRVAEEINRLQPGAYLKVVATDPAFPDDIEAWVQKTGNGLVKKGKTEHGFTVLLRKGTEK